LSRINASASVSEEQVRNALKEGRVTSGRRLRWDRVLIILACAAFHAALIVGLVVWLH